MAPLVSAKIYSDLQKPWCPRQDSNLPVPAPPSCKNCPLTGHFACRVRWLMLAGTVEISHEYRTTRGGER
jgi:hypothetical protein